MSNKFFSKFFSDKKIFSINFKTDFRIDWLLFFFLITLSFNLRYIFNFNSIQKIEGFRENITLSFSLFELAVYSWIFLYLTHFKGSNILKKTIQQDHWLWIASLIILFYNFYNSLLPSTNFVKIINTLKFIFIFLFFSLFKEKINQLKNPWNFWFKFCFIFLITGIFQSLLVILQFYHQQALGLFILGENHFSVNQLGVAKINIGVKKIVRPYGTFPHPNLLGTFLVFCYACGLFLFNQKEKIIFSFKKIKNIQLIWLSNSFLFSALFLISGGIFLTFSRSVWFGWFIFNFFFFYFNLLKIDNLEKLENRLEKIKRNSSRKLILFIFSLVALLSFLSFCFFPFLKERLCIKNCSNDRSYQLRQIYQKAALKLIHSHLFLGVGKENFIDNLKNNPLLKEEKTKLEAWEIQPVHNFYLIILSETGIVVFSCFLITFFRGIKKIIFSFSVNSSSNNFLVKNPLFLVFFVFLLLASFDHYFWTLNQGNWLFFLALAIKEHFLYTEKII